MSVSIAAPWQLPLWTSVTEDHGVASAIARDFAVGVPSLTLLVALPLGRRLALLLSLPSGQRLALLLAPP